MGYSENGGLFYRELEDEVDVSGIKHLSFGGEEDRIELPRLNEWYT